MTMNTNHFQELNYHLIGKDIRNGVPHQDESVEILQFWSNGGNFIVRNNIYPILPGAVLVVNGSELHHSNPSDLSKYVRSKIILPISFFKTVCGICGLNQICRLITEGSGSFFRSYSVSNLHSQEIDRAFHEIETNYKNRSASSTALALCVRSLIQILSILQDSITEPGPEEVNNAPQPFVQLSDYINKNMQNWKDFSLKKLSNELHISESYASHLFKNLTGKSITNVSMELRISEAKKLLLNTDMKVNEISDFMEFKDSSTFCKTFRKIVGQTPRNYRVVRESYENSCAPAVHYQKKKREENDE